VFIHPNLDWYAGVSERKTVVPRCPFATFERCPRFYQSISLLGDVGITTKIAPAEDKQLLDLWSKTDVWPKTMEQETGVYGDKHLFSNFCPEVAFETFGLFATSLSRFSDDIDRDSRHQALAKSGVAGGHDWRWRWEHVTPQHYTECPLYSILKASPVTVAKAREEILQLRPGMYGVSVDLKGLWAKLRSWWSA
jgi:hypothetical protein